MQTVGMHGELSLWKVKKHLVIMHIKERLRGPHRSSGSFETSINVGVTIKEYALLTSVKRLGETTINVSFLTECPKWASKVRMKIQNTTEMSLKLKLMPYVVTVYDVMSRGISISFFSVVEQHQASKEWITAYVRFCHIHSCFKASLWLYSTYNIDKYR